MLETTSGSDGSAESGGVGEPAPDVKPAVESERRGFRTDREGACRTRRSTSETWPGSTGRPGRWVTQCRQEAPRTRQRSLVAAAGDGYPSREGKSRRYAHAHGILSRARPARSGSFGSHATVRGLSPPEPTMRRGRPSRPAYSKFAAAHEIGHELKASCRAGQASPSAWPGRREPCIETASRPPDGKGCRPRRCCAARFSNSIGS